MKYLCDTDPNCDEEHSFPVGLKEKLGSYGVDALLQMVMS